MSFDDVYTVLFGAKTSDELVSEFMAGREDGLPEWLGARVQEVLHGPGDARLRAEFARGALEHWDSIVSGLNEAAERWADKRRGKSDERR